MDWKICIEWLKRNRKRLVLGSVSCFIALLFFVTFILPSIVRNLAEKAIAESTGRMATIAGISINPLAMSVEIEGFKLYEADKITPFFELGRLKAALSLASIYRLAPVVKELSIESPRIRLVRTAENRYNFTDIIDFISKQPKTAKKTQAHFSINNITLSKGSIDFDDKAVAGGKQHTIRDLQIALPFISNIPYLAEKHTDPKLSALVNGARFDFGGKAKPLAKAVEATINLKLEKLDLPHYLPYLPADIPVKIDRGSLTLNLDLNYKVYASKKPELNISGLTRLEDISVAEKTGTALAGLKSIDLQSKMIEVFSKTIDIEKISIEGLTINASRDSKGLTNIHRLLPAEKTAKKQPGKADNKKQDAHKQDPLVKVSEITLSNGQISFSDALPKGGFKTRLSNISLKVKDFSNSKNAKTGYEISIDGDGGEKISASGSAVIAPLSVDSTFEVKNIALQKGWPYLQEFITKTLKGSLAVKGKVDFSNEKGINLTEAEVGLNDFKAAFGDRDGVELSRLAVTGISFNQKENRAEAGEIRLARGKVAVSLETDGKISPMLLLVEKPTVISPPVEKQPAPPVNETKSLRWKIGKVNISGLSTSFTDKTFVEPPVFTLSNIRFSSNNLTGPALSAIPVNFSATYGKDTPVQATGTLTPAPVRYVGNASFAKLPIRDFESYLPDNLNLFILAGTIDSNMKLDVGLGRDAKPKGNFAGSLGIRGFHAVDSLHEEDLVKWESLQLDQINGNIDPVSLEIRQIAINGVYSRIAVRKDGTLNLQNLVANDKVQKGETKTQEPAHPARHQSVAVNTASHQPPVKPRIRIDNLTVQGGTIDFSDAHLSKHFRTTFHNLGGRVSGLNSEMNTRADVDLRGNLENHSPLQITGKVNPLRDDLFVYLTISFKDIELSPATPYSGTYLGYQITRGKLFLDLKYHIENKNLKASNKVFIDQFTFGDSVKSDKATKLPVRLGIALLKDRNGQINLDLPVSGRTDDPEFSIWGVVWKVVVNLFTKAATSPFALISSMFGSGEDISSINFTPGSAALLPSEEKKLATLATAMVQRPALRVELSGYVDSNNDPEGYRYEILNHKMRQEKYLELVKNSKIAKDDDADKMVIEPSEYSNYLNAVYRKEKFPKPRNMIGMIKDLPDAEMKKLIIASTKVGDTELRQLAARRTAIVRNYLINKGKIESGRLFQKQEDIQKLPKESAASRARVEMNPIVQ